MRCIKEIRKVGLKDWLWFTVWLGRDEFSNKLDLSNYYSQGELNLTKTQEAMDKLMQDRNRAHRIDMELDDIKYSVNLKVV